MRRAFIVGCPRSGTTIVQAMLARHPEVFTVPETAFFQRLLGDIHCRLLGDFHESAGNRVAKSPRRTLGHRLGLTSKDGRREFVMLQHSLLGKGTIAARVPWLQRTCAVHFIGLLDCLAEQAGRSTWIEKTPHHLLYLNEIEQYFPDARIVHVVRPGIDVLASINDAYFRYGIEAFSGSLMQWVRRWNHAVQIHRSRIGVTNHHLIFHEDLVNDPAKELERLCLFMGLSSYTVLDDSCHQNIADPESEPWKRDALSGLPQRVDRKVTNQFGPQLREWLRERLISYEELYEAAHEGT